MKESFGDRFGPFVFLGVAIVLLLMLIFSIQSCEKKRLDPWCRAHGYNHGKYELGYGGGSFCVDAKGQMIRVEGP